MSLEVCDIVVRFGPNAVVDGVSLHIPDGEVVALLGPSGSGKSTLLRVIAGLITPSSGSVHINGVDITALAAHRRGVGLVFQDNQLFPHLDVATNIDFGLRMQPRGAAGHRTPERRTPERRTPERRTPERRAPERRARVGELLHLVGLTGFERRAVGSLSGGEAKRVALARSLAPAPAILLLDEPLTGLDDELHDRLAADLALILRDTATTALLVTHDATEAALVADRVVMLTSLNKPAP